MPDARRDQRARRRLRRWRDVLRRLAPPPRRAVAARRGRAPHGRAAAGDSLQPRVLLDWWAVARCQRTRCCSRPIRAAAQLPVEPDAVPRSAATRPSVRVVVAAALACDAAPLLEPAQVPAGGCRTGLGQHDAAPGRPTRRRRCSSWQRALAVDGFLMFSTLGPGSLARPARAVRRAPAGRRRTRPSSTCTTWATCWCRPASPTR